MPKVSVVMPVYNGEKYIREAIDSILSQTFTDWEFLIINEFGSNEAVTAILQEYAATDDRIQVIQNKERLGISASMNVGLDLAQGEYVARMDADDISAPLRFEKQVNYLDAHPEISMCGVKVHIFGNENMEWDIEEDTKQLKTDILFFSPSVHPTVMVRRSVLKEYSFCYDTSFSASEDYELFSKICAVAEISNLDEVLFHYRLLSNNATYRNNDVGYKLYLDVMDRQFRKLGLEFNLDELQLLSPHYGLKKAKGKEVLARLIRLDLLLKKILFANERVGLYDRHYLSHTLYKMYKKAFTSIPWACTDYDSERAKEFYEKSIFSHEYFYEPKAKEYTPKISVLMPTYNSEDYVADTVWSILDQTFEDFEFIVINEYGSKDETERIINMFGDPRIRVINNQEKLGLAESLNLGIRLAKTEYIARVDADDLYCKDRLKLQYEFMEKNPEYGVCGSWQHHFGIDTNHIHKVPVSHEELKAQLIYNCELCHSTLMLRKSLFLKNNLFYDKTKYAEDYELWTRAIHQFKFTNLPLVLGQYRVGDNNITAGKLGKLSVESGQIANQNITKYLGVSIPQDHIKYLSGWVNEFNRIKSKAEYKKALEQEQQILRAMWYANERMAVYDPAALLKTINKRWRWSVNQLAYRENLGEICDIDTLFQKYGISDGAAYQRAQKARMPASIKNYIKKILRTLYYPFKKYIFDKIHQHLWDIDGHLMDATTEVKQTIRDASGCIKDQLQEFLQAESSPIREQVIDCVTKSIIETLTAQLESEMLQTKAELEKSILNAVESRLSETVKTINETTDSRIWNAEKLINQTMDAKVWMTQLELEKHADKNAKNLQLITACPDNTTKKAFVIGVPFHSNLGDQTQTYCIEQWLKKEYPQHIIVEVDSAVCDDDDVYDLCRHLKMKSTKEDVVVLHSGYHVTDLFLNEFYTFIAAANVFSSNRILCFPQSIYFADQKNAILLQQLMDHSNFILYAREPYSLRIAQRYLPAEKCRLLPDIVTSLIGRYPIQAAERKGVLFVKRNPNDTGDKENQYSIEQLQQIKSQLQEEGIDVDFTDTTLTDPSSQIKENREKYIAQTVRQYSQYRLVVTDRMHGMIFALIANTPVVTLNSKSPKLESATALFLEDNELSQYILHCQSPEFLAESIRKMLSRKLSYQISDNFAKKYFDGLSPEQF